MLPASAQNTSLVSMATRSANSLPGLGGVPLARDWEIDFDELLEQMHEAGDGEIAEYGIFDS